MSTRRIRTINTTALYFIALVVIVVAFLLLGGGPWMTGMIHGNRSIGMSNWNWTQILISLALGFLLGWIFNRRK
jgi:H+/Cl- antiporter ClcA